MNNHLHHHEMYYDQPSSRSPGAHRHQQQTLHRQPSRQFDAYGQMPNNIYAPDDHTLRYDGNRFDRMNATMQGGGYGYEMPSAQTWNPSAFGGGNNFPNFGASGRMKSTSRGRSALPTVSATIHGSCENSSGFIADYRPNRHGSISSSYLQLIHMVVSAPLHLEARSSALSNTRPILMRSLYQPLLSSRIYPLR